MSGTVIERLLLEIRERIPLFLSRISPGPLFTHHFQSCSPGKGSTPLPQALISLGKAAGGMTSCLSSLYKIPPSKTLTVLPVGYPSPPEKFPCIYGPHPIPDEQSLSITKRIKEFIASLPPDIEVAVAISGGSSSLVADPVFPVTISEKARITRKLMDAGAPIDVINNVRIHLSMIKGGGLAALLFPRLCRTFILSDIPGESTGLVGSSLMFPVPRNGPRMLETLELWLNGEIPDTTRRTLSDNQLPDFSDRINPDNRYGVTIASSETLLTVAREVFLDSPLTAGLPHHILTAELKGEAKEAASVLASQILWATRKSGSGSVWLCAGETTVNLEGAPGIGRGGRTIELGLAMTIALSPLPAIVLCLASDGWDGNSGLTGILAGTPSLADPIHFKMVRQSLLFHDTGTFAERFGMAIKTGPTGTNLNDLLMVIVP